ncbi:MAG TPA: YjdF family protein [Bacillota bacterium]|nr:YjdF family protein [Bacillota bacterium]
MGIKLTVYFEEPFWVGVFERSTEDRLETARVVFGAEPKDIEVYEWILNRFNTLTFSRPLVQEIKAQAHINPKRLQRQIRKEVAGLGVGTKAQQALQQEYEVRKKEHRDQIKLDRKARATQQFLLRQKKKKEQKKGH